MKFPYYQQLDQKDCGPTCLKMIAKHFGRSISLQTLRERTEINKQGVSLLGISRAAESVGIRSVAVQISLEKLMKDAPLPCVVHWEQNHFVVLYGIKKNIKNKILNRSSVTEFSVSVADPARGLIKYTGDEFLSGWLNFHNNGKGEGIALLMEPQPQFFDGADDKENKLGIKRLLHYLFFYKKLLFQLGLGLIVGSALQFIFPFLTQSIVDIGINTENLNFIYLVLIAQLMLFLGRISVEFIRSWILLHISARINISILSDFLIKLMRLPIAFFDMKHYGDIMQRVNDHHRIEAFLTNTSLNTIFSVFNLLIFGGLLAYYDITIFCIFLFSCILYAGWIIIFLNQRRKLDYKTFEFGAKNQSALFQLIQGMQEIKLSNSETQKRWDWESIQASLFKLNIRGLALTQYQLAGAFFINEGKNIFITFFAAKAVIEGQLTLGAMLSIQYIIGQLNSPVDQLIQFIHLTQDAKISIERLNEIHELEDEKPSMNEGVTIIPENRTLNIRNVYFKYPGVAPEPILKGINLSIPAGKTTAIVGMSGSGKTTLLKLLLKFYEPISGDILLGETKLNNLNHHLWRSECGVVMQDGFIFSSSIAENITVGDEHPDVNQLINAVRIANIQDFVESLPLSYNTKIGAEGNGLSQGQKQRILIARAVYKNPKFIFFDEATNSLDANNETLIMHNLDQFFKGRTVVIVAHRLSTVKNADQIIVLDKGQIIEQGTHAELINRHGNYYNLVKNQLELGN